MESIREKLESLLRSLASDALEEDENTKRARHSSGQVMRLSLNARRTEQGYRGAEVFVGPSRTEDAYVAAVLALHGEEMEEEKRAELEHWKTLSKDEQDAIQMQENFGLAPGDAYEIVDEQDFRDCMKAKRASRKRIPRGRA